MSSAYDSRTSTFSPNGVLLQVTYAMQSIQRAPLTMALMTTEGVVFASERRPKGPLVDKERPQIRDISGEKTYKIDEHIGYTVAGLAADANILVDHSRARCQQYTYTYGEPMPVEDLCQLICDIKQGYTMYGSQRPFGVALLCGGWDRHHGFQLYHTEPSGDYRAWKAYAIGKEEGTAQGLLKNEWKETLTLEEGLLLALKILSKVLDAVTLKPELVEVSTLSRRKGSTPVFHILTDDEVVPRIAAAEEARKKEDEEREERRKKNAAELLAQQQQAKKD
jgi:20S proteasome subunit alpha 3